MLQVRFKLLSAPILRSLHMFVKSVELALVRRQAQVSTVDEIQHEFPKEEGVIIFIFHHFYCMTGTL